MESISNVFIFSDFQIRQLKLRGIHWWGITSRLDEFDGCIEVATRLQATKSSDAGGCFEPRNQAWNKIIP